MPRKLVALIVSVIVVFALSLNIVDSYISSFSKQYCYDTLEVIPEHNVGLILGTSRILPNGKLNSYYNLRIDAAVNLFKHNKVKYFLISGDNSRKDYDEPAMIKNDLITKGIPENIIYRDYAGFRTLDSIIRANIIFNLNDFTIISQKFHNERAIFLARNNNLKAIGYNAKMPGDGKQRLVVLLREKLARIMAVLDLYVFNTQPKFLGDPIEIGKTPPN